MVTGWPRDPGHQAKERGPGMKVAVMLSSAVVETYRSGPYSGKQRVFHVHDFDCVDLA